MSDPRFELNRIPDNYQDFLSVKKNVGKTRNPFGDLAIYFAESLDYGLNQIGRAAENSMKKTIRESTTQWGTKRMTGVSGKWTFRPYGRSAGREETGWMYDSVDYDIVNNQNQHTVSFGWINWQEEYFLLQEYGFQGVQIMGGVTGDMPRFKKTSKTYSVKGMGSLEAAKRVVDRMAPSFEQGAWNEALRKLKAKGGTF
jgi:hypothetical protein